MSGTQSHQSMEQHSQILPAARAMAKSNMTFENKTLVSICIGSVHACVYVCTRMCIHGHAGTCGQSFSAPSSQGQRPYFSYSPYMNK